MQPIMMHYNISKLPALITHVRLGCICLPGTNTPAYCTKNQRYRKKSFILQVLAFKRIMKQADDTDVLAQSINEYR